MALYDSYEAIEVSIDQYSGVFLLLVFYLFQSQKTLHLVYTILLHIALLDPQCIQCYLSREMCHMSNVTCHVTCDM